ncbi:hypothetical protein FALBO_8561 [Fusarium albosuccineum]|uniref:Uncharacterized protein n=1 Tax=Fusarium albosuccineum TaxID=1237068 RepID=A0A8H4P6U3_9HYPO|nr:hypothetical protein FALBO_8561 [Fusarium albosuccineum]
MAGRLKNAIKKRASRLFHGDQAQNPPEGPIPSDSGSNANGTAGNAKPRHRKSLSLLNRISRTDRESPTERDINTSDSVAHPAIHPLAAGPAPRTPRLERPHPGLDSAPAAKHSSEGSDASLRRASQLTERERKLSHSADADELHTRLSQLAIAREPGHPPTELRPSTQDADTAEEAQYELVNDEVFRATNGDTDFHLQNTVDIDHAVHHRAPVIQEQIRPHVHTIYEPRRTRSIHHHEHRKLIQPIIDPNPTILPEQHWLQDEQTGELYRIPDELGEKLM